MIRSFTKRVASPVVVIVFFAIGFGGTTMVDQAQGAVWKAPSVCNPNFPCTGSYTASTVYFSSLPPSACNCVLSGIGPKQICDTGASSCLVAGTDFCSGQCAYIGGGLPPGCSVNFSSC